MAALDEFFNKAINIARDLGEARTRRRQKQQDVQNLATFSALNIEDRRSRTSEARQLSDADLGQQRVDLGQAELAVRENLGQGQLDINKQLANIQGRGEDRAQAGFQRTGALFKRFFPDPDAGSPGNGGASRRFRAQSDQGVLNSAREIANSNNRSVLGSSKVQDVVSQSKRRTQVTDSLEQDLLNLRNR